MRSVRQERYVDENSLNRSLGPNAQVCARHPEEKRLVPIENNLQIIQVNFSPYRRNQLLKNKLNCTHCSALFLHIVTVVLFSMPIFCIGASYAIDNYLGF